MKLQYPAQYNAQNFIVKKRVLTENLIVLNVKNKQFQITWSLLTRLSYQRQNTDYYYKNRNIEKLAQRQME